jgi:hypothetical protein
MKSDVSRLNMTPAKEPGNYEECERLSRYRFKTSEFLE